MSHNLKGLPHVLSNLALCKLLRLLSWEFALVAGCFKIPFLKKKKETREKEKKSTFLLLLLQEIGNGGMAWHAATFYTRATGGGGAGGCPRRAWFSHGIQKGS